MIELTNKYRYAIYATLLLLPTFYNIRVEFYLIFAFAVFWFERKQLLRLKQEFVSTPFHPDYLKTFWLVMLILIVSLANKIFNGNEILCLKDYYSAFYLLPLLILSSRLVYSEKFFRFLVFITILECLVGILEYFYGVRTFLGTAAEGNTIEDYSLLYNSRVYGLSGNSSIFGYKVLLGFLLIDFIKLNRRIEWLLRVILLVGLLISFSRVVVVVLIVYWIIRFLIYIIKILQDKKMFSVISGQFSLCVILLMFIFHSELLNQISRGEHSAESSYSEDMVFTPGDPQGCDETHAILMVQGTIDPQEQKIGDRLMMSAENIQSSGRKLIWLNYLNFIEDHPWFGNGSDKLMLRSWQPEKKVYKLFHAHNSYLQLIATNGILISLLYLLFYIFYFKSRNYLALGVILLYSVGNYGIFWGFSYMDVLFLIFLNANLKSGYEH